MRNLSLALAVCALIAVAPAAAQPDPPRDRAVQQLRIYELYDATREAFHARFRDHAMRIMARYGFDIVAMWESRRDGRPLFVYLLDWPNEAAMRSAWDGFLADREWIRIKQETRGQGPMVDDIEDRVLRLTDYSPRFLRPEPQDAGEAGNRTLDRHDASHRTVDR